MTRCFAARARRTRLDGLDGVLNLLFQRGRERGGCDPQGVSAGASAQRRVSTAAEQGVRAWNRRPSGLNVFTPRSYSLLRSRGARASAPGARRRCAAARSERDSNPNPLACCSALSTARAARRTHRVMNILRCWLLGERSRRAQARRALRWWGRKGTAGLGRGAPALSGRSAAAGSTGPGEAEGVSENLNWALIQARDSRPEDRCAAAARTERV